jgi:hypothetical protein
MPFLTHSHTPQLIALFSDGARRVFGAILRILKNGKVRPKSDLKTVAHVVSVSRLPEGISAECGWER